MTPETTLPKATVAQLRESLGVAEQRAAHAEWKAAFIQNNHAANVREARAAATWRTATFALVLGLAAGAAAAFAVMWSTLPLASEIALQSQALAEASKAFATPQ